MSDLFGKLQSGISRVAFEADKGARISKAQLELSGLKKSLEISHREAGRKLYELYSAGEVDHEQMGEVCSQIAEQLQQISEKEKTIEAIKAQVFAATTLSPASMRSASTGQAELATRSGTVVQAPEASASATGSSPDTTPEVKSCPSCGASAPVEAVFCPRCGSRFPDSS